MRHLAALALAAASFSLAACGVPPEVEQTGANDDDIIIVDFRPDLVPTLTISDSGFPYVYPPVSSYVTNNGILDAGPSKLRLECFAYNSGGFYVGQCFSTIMIDVPALPGGQSFYPSLPYTPGPLACKTAKCVVRLTADYNSQVNEKNEDNNVVERVKIP